MATTPNIRFIDHDTNYNIWYNISMLKRYRYRAYPTGEQTQAAMRTFGCVRTVYNDFIAERSRLYADGRHTAVSFDETAKNTTTLAKLRPERAWLADVSSTPLQQATRDARQAYSHFFSSVTGKRAGKRVGLPRFKSRRDHQQKARFTRNCGFSVRETTHGVGFVRLPKIGHVRFTLSRPLPSDPSSVTLIREGDSRYYVSFVVDVPSQTADTTNTVAGVDVGLFDLATIALSDGRRYKVANPRHLKTRARKLARCQRALSRTKKGSKNRDKARRRLATEYRKIRETHRDFLHKTALSLVRENQAIAVEDIFVTGLMQTRMARSIADASWGTFLRLIREKATAYGRDVFVIDRWTPTTRTCSVCGTVGEKKSLAVREWTCARCDTRLDRDYNAAVNIMVAAGLAETLNACGGSVRQRLAVADPVKQEPTEQLRC